MELLNVCLLVQTKSRRCPAEHCVFVYIGSTPPAILWAPHCVRAVGCLRRFVPSQVCHIRVCYTQECSYALGQGVPSQYKRVNQMQKSFLSIYRSITLVRRIRRRTFALFTMHFKELNDAIHTKTIP